MFSHVKRTVQPDGSLLLEVEVERRERKIVLSSVVAKDDRLDGKEVESTVKEALSIAEDACEVLAALRPIAEKISASKEICESIGFGSPEWARWGEVAKRIHCQ